MGAVQVLGFNRLPYHSTGYWLLEGSARLPECSLREASHHCEEDEQHREAEAHGHRRLSE